MKGSAAALDFETEAGRKDRIDGAQTLQSRSL